MLKYTLLYIFLVMAAGAQSLAPFTVGVLQCGLVKRGIDSVQLFCYSPAPTCNGCDTVKPLSNNSISKVYTLPSDSPGLEIRAGFGPDQIWVILNVVNGGMYYQIITTDGSKTGVLVDVFASIGAGCGLPSNLPRFTWGASSQGISKNCITIWNDAWLDCCVTG